MDAEMRRLVQVAEARDQAAANETRDRADIGHAWQELIDQLHASERSLLAWDNGGRFGPLDTAEGYRFILHQLRYGIDLMLESDPDRPSFVPMTDSIIKLYGDNADALYHYTNISGVGGARYRITGKRNDAAFLSFQVYRGPERGDTRQATLDDINFRRMDLKPDGSFDIAVGGPRQDRNSLALDEDATCIIVRAYYLDVLKDRHAEFKIERATPIAPRPPWTLQEVAAGIRRIASFTRTAEDMRPREVQTWNQFSEPFQFQKSMKGWGTVDNIYTRCLFRIEPDEALVIDARTVPAPYWGIQLWNIHPQSLDFRDRQICLNARSMKVEPDGRFRAIVASTDPKLPNWLDAAGHRIGMVFVRWTLAEQKLEKPTARVVKLKDLRRA